jgi:uncharacterized membrane protein
LVFLSAAVHSRNFEILYRTQNPVDAKRNHLPKRCKMRKERFELFTDAVIAIIMTLMILEIKLPELTVGSLWTFFQHIAIYALSFVVIAITWINHHIMFLHVEKIPTKVIWINFLMLFSMSLIPLATGHLGEHFFQKESHMFYAGIMTAVAVPYTILQLNVNRILTNKGFEERNRFNWLNWVATFLYILSIPLSLISIYISTTIYLIIPIIYFALPKKMIPLY